MTTTLDPTEEPVRFGRHGAPETGLTKETDPTDNRFVGVVCEGAKGGQRTVFSGGTRQELVR